MKKIDVKELYKNEPVGWWDNYQPMLNAFGKIAIQVDDDDYQGDSRLLFDENSKIGVLIFGWGSCSGCDALQACDSWEELQELCNSLQKDIKWFDDKKQALDYFINHDWQGGYSWHQAETKEFINKCIEYLSADVVEVVRCKDCAVPHNQWTGCPKLNGLVTHPDFYCSYAAKKWTKVLPTFMSGAERK